MAKKRSFIVLTVLVVFLCTGCGSKLREGEICGKEFRRACTTTVIMPLTISNRKTSTTMYIPYIVRYPDRWSITIKAYRDNDGRWETATYWVTKEVFDAVRIGDQFKYDAGTCMDDEPYIREKQTD